MSESDQTPYTEQAPQPDDGTFDDGKTFKDRKAGLVFFGLVQIAIGGVLGLVALFQVLMANLPDQVFEEAGAAAPSGLGFSFFAILAPMAVLLVWLGVGSILARRWARAISLVLGWIGLVFGVVSLLALTFAAPSFSETLAEASADSSLSAEQMEMMGTVMKRVMFFFHLAFYVVLPGLMVLFFRQKDVEATCQARDPKTRWTDRCPLPVLALCILLVAGGYQCVTGGLSAFRMFPLFGTLINGLPAGILLVASGAVLLFLAWGLYKLNRTAWVASIAFSVVGLASAILTTVRIEPSDIFAGMDLPAEQLQAMTASWPDPMYMVLYMGFWGIAWLGCFWYVKRYFPGGGI